MKFSCARCEYEAPSKAHYIRHLRSKKPCPVRNEDTPRNALLEQLMVEPERKCETRQCEWCDKSVAKVNYARHRTVCSKRPGQDSDNNVREQQTPSHDASTSYAVVMNAIQLQQLKESIKKELMQEMVSASSKVVNNTYIVNGNVNNVQNNTINLHNFGQEDTSYLTEDFLSYCLLNPRKGMTSLIENIHYNKEHPMNQNLRCKSLKQNAFEKYVDAEWRACDASNTLDELMKKGYRILNAHYSEHFMNDPTLFDDECKQKAYERFRFLSDTSCNDYHAVKRELRLLVKDRTMYLLEPPNET